MPTRKGSIHLFQFAGVNVFLHWSWFLVALYEINNRRSQYSSFTWNVLEYLALFLIVLLHEFGHSLACRQVGGKADQIVLWPLGGVAYVAPPPRPGATLWSIAAGPLVNVVLVFILGIVWIMGRAMNWPGAMPNAYAFLKAVSVVNLGLLIFNMLPIHPLDGGQILRSLLWFVLGRARSLMVTTVVGFGGVALLIVGAVLAKDVWLGVLSAFILLNCFGGLLHAHALTRAANAPRNDRFACPACNAAPPVGTFWMCAKCQQRFDTFAAQAVCPHCGTHFTVTQCLDCGTSRPVSEWAVPPPIAAKS